ncbi:MAG: gliding motility lipoprotein GldD, partial [Algicola sp.]|nr:gliding motility lipoprotein GldD [Algicola sp.]
MKKLLLLSIIISCIACGSDPIPKPKAMLRLEYPEPSYKKVDIPLPFTFEKNELADPISNIKLDGIHNIYGVDINYPKLK